MKHILVIQAARFGDLVQTARLIRTLVRDYRVHLALDASLEPLAEIIYPETAPHGLRLHCEPNAAAMAHNERIFAQLRALDFHRIYNCNFSGFTGALCRLFDTEKIIGYRPAHNSLGGELRSPWARTGFRAGAMRSSSPLNLVDFWAWFAESPVSPHKVFPSPGARGAGIGVALAGREKRRTLPVAILAEIVQIACRILNPAKIKLLGTKAEASRARQLLRRLPAAMQNMVADLCGQTDLPELVAEIRDLDLLLTPDTGIMHLGALLGVPLIAFFLSSAWCHETGPYGAGHIIFQAAPACAPCLEKASCEHGLACHEVYKTPEFLRSFAMALQNEQNLAAPVGLQIWRSGFDNLGAKLELLAGKDPWLHARSAARSIIKQELELESPGSATENPDYKRLFTHFVPDQEWMLPPWRYC